MAEFNPAYQSIYDAAKTRLAANVADKRRLALRGAAAAGVVSTAGNSGNSQIPQDEINAEAVRSEADLGANVAQAQETERLQDKGFEQRKELMNLSASLSEAAAARQRELERRAGKSAITGQIIGGVLGGAGGYLAKKYL